MRATRWLGGLGLCLAAAWTARVGAEVLLVEDGRPAAAIILASGPTRAAQLAAFEIQEHVRLIADATLPIVREGTPVEGLKLFVGCPRAAGRRNVWLKDNGDISLRRLTSSMIHDGQHLYLKLVEDALDRTPSAGDRWELAAFDCATEDRYTLWIDAAGTLTGQTQGSGGPQAWADHGARAISRAADGQWSVTVALPLSALPLGPDGRLFMNLRRHDATGEDSPVLVATGDAFETGKTGARVTFDKTPAATAPAPSAGDLIADCDFSGGGDKVEDRSSRGNAGKLFGAVRRDAAGLTFTDGNQYLEFAGLKGFDPTNYTFACWVRYGGAADQPGSLRLFTAGDFFCEITKPNRQLSARWKGADGKLTGRGPNGPELTPGVWHHIVLTHMTAAPSPSLRTGASDWLSRPAWSPPAGRTRCGASAGRRNLRLGTRSSARSGTYGSTVGSYRPPRSWPPMRRTMRRNGIY